MEQKKVPSLKETVLENDALLSELADLDEAANHKFLSLETQITLAHVTQLKPRAKPGPKPGPRKKPSRVGPDIIQNCPHSRCCIRFCKAASLLKPGRTPESGDAWERFCGKHLPANVKKNTERLASFSKEAAVKGQAVIAERRERLVLHTEKTNIVTEPVAYGPMAPSGERETKGWGLVGKGSPLHYFAEADWFSLCGRRFMKNQPVAPNFGPLRCEQCMTLMLFTHRARE